MSWQIVDMNELSQVGLGCCCNPSSAGFVCYCGSSLRPPFPLAALSPCGAKHTVCHVLVLASSSDFYKKHYASPDSALSSSCVLLGMILTYDDASNGALPQHEGIALALVTTHLIAQWPAGS